MYQWHHSAIFWSSVTDFVFIGYLQLNHEFNKIIFLMLIMALWTLYLCITYQCTYRFIFHFELECFLLVFIMFYRVVVLMLRFSSLVLGSSNPLVSHSSTPCDLQTPCNVIVNKKISISQQYHANCTLF